MDISSLSAAALNMNSGQNQTILTTTMVKMDVAQQNKIADLLAANVQLSSQAASKPDSRYQISLYV